MSTENKTKIKNFKTYWSTLSKKDKNSLRSTLTYVLGISENQFYQKLRDNSFEPHERALIARVLKMEQQTLFPNEPIIFKVVDIKPLFAI